MPPGYSAFWINNVTTNQREMLLEHFEWNEHIWADG